jgi:hypothetical protein
MGIKFDTFPYTIKILQINVIISIIIIFIQLYHKKYYHSKKTYLFTNKKTIMIESNHTYMDVLLNTTLGRKYGI